MTLETCRVLLGRLSALSERRWILLLLCVAIVARIAWAVSVLPRTPVVDEQNYVGHAVRLAEGLGYVNGDGERVAYWPVGYPVVLAAAYTLLGQSELTAVSLQILFGIATCLLISILGSATFGPAVGRFAALMIGLYPTHVFYSTLYLTEPLFTLLVTAAQMLLLRSLQSWPAAVFAGLALGCATLVRPAALLLTGFVYLWYWIQGLRRRALVQTLLVGCGTLAAISPWLARNHDLTGRWTVVSTTGGYNFWIGNHPGAFGGYAYSREILSALRDGDDLSHGYRLGVEAILNRPMEAAVRMVRKASYFLALETDGVLWNLNGLPARPALPVTLALLGAANAGYVVVLALAVLGMLTTARGHPLGSLFLVISGYYVLIALAFFGDPRHHYPLLPVATIFAARAVVQDLPAILERKNRRLLVVWAVIVAGFLALMAANVMIKMAEMKALGR